MQSIEPTVTNEEESELLGVPLHSPAFLFERTSRTVEGETIEFVRSLYRGDRYRLVAELSQRRDARSRSHPPSRSSRATARDLPMSRAGVSYFGVRILRHVRRDLEDIRARGYSAVLHTFSENDLAYYRGTMAEIVAASHDVGLEVQMCPWGLGRTFGGEAESRWVTFHPEACQVLDDGRRVATGCLNQPAYRAFCKEWADATIEAGTDYVFWDEPHWTVPEHVGVADAERWACVCRKCAASYRAWTCQWV